MFSLGLIVQSVGLQIQYDRQCKLYKGGIVLKRLIAVIVVLVLALTVMTGCNGSGSGGNAAGGGAIAGLEGKNISEDPIKVAFIPISTAGYTNVIVEQAADAIMSSYPNLTVTFFDAGYDSTTQISLISECIAQGFDAIIMEVTDSVALSPTIREAEEAGIAVITTNMGCEAVHTMHIENNSFNSGWIAGEAIAKELKGEGKVIILDVPAELKAVALHGTGFEDYATENTNFEIIDYQNIAGFSQEEANTVMRDLLTKHDDISAVYCAADDVAMGALQAIEAAGRGNEGILIWGSDCYPAAIEAIKAGKIFGTCWADQYGLSKTALNMALYFIETGITSATAGYEATPTIQAAFTAVTKENVDAITPQTHWPEYS